LECDARFASSEWWPFWSGARAAAAASVERAARLLARPSVKNVVFFTGAGASAESGMPAFRETVAGAADVDADGVRVGPATPLDALLPVWKTHDPEKYSTVSAFREDPTTVLVPAQEDVRPDAGVGAERRARRDRDPRR
jgi:NAD-dependent SIR2 family protein deacetylase